jgi:multisubunit Na+/H+ antiporter MnhB subunit
MVVVTMAAVLPYIIFFLFTWYCKALFQPKNVFKCNFAVSAVVFLAGNLIHLMVLNHGLKSMCPDIYLFWYFFNQCANIPNGNDILMISNSYK